MKRLGLLSIILVFLIIGCSTDGQQSADGKLAPQSAESRRAEILEKEKQFGTPDISNSLGKAKAKELVTLYQNYVSVNPKDSISAEYLFKAADLSVGLGQYQAALNLLDRLITDFPKFDRGAEMMLFKGFICENYMSNQGLSRRLAAAGTGCAGTALRASPHPVARRRNPRSGDGPSAWCIGEVARLKQVSLHSSRPIL